MEAKFWYVVCYDITEPKRWRKVYSIPSATAH
jgi:CRISPR/Cas system-associated endoribonuclease Cas2